jgi:hypothetical protein
MKKIEKISVKEYKEKYEHKTFFKKNKYNAKKVLLDGMKFDSISEGDFYLELLQQKNCGLIKEIQCQAKEEFYIYDKFICNYYVDFKIEHNDGTIEYIEHKGMATDLWKMKWKMLLAKYSDEIKDGKVICTINWYRQKFNIKNLLKPYKTN